MSGASAGKCAEPEFAALRIADYGVEPEQDEAVLLAGHPHGVRRHVIGPVQFDGAETGARRRVDAIEQGKLRPHETEIGGKARHVSAI